MEINTEVTLTPKQVAEAIFDMYLDEQAEMFEHLYDLYSSEHYIMMQFMCTRDKCMERGGMYGKAMSAFQAMFASAYKYMWE